MTGSPAARAGLKAGDAVLQFGNAANLPQLASQVCVGVRINVQVMGKDGVISECIVVPRPFDPKKPHSLLGCMMSDVCPARFLPHPALRGHARKSEAGPKMGALSTKQQEKTPSFALVVKAHDGIPDSEKLLRRLPRWHDDDASEIPWDEEDDDALSSCSAEESGVSFQSTRGNEKGPRWVSDRCTRATASTGHRQSGASSVRNGRSPNADSRPPGRANHSNASLPPGLALNRRPMWRSRLALVIASILNATHGYAFLSAPSLGKARANEVFKSLGDDLVMLATTSCERVTSRHLAQDEDSSAYNGGAGLTISTFAWVALVVASLQCLLTVSGLWLALTPSNGVCPHCSRRSCVLVCIERLRFSFELLYPPAALLLWLTLAAVTMYCLTFRWEAEVLIQSYWHCLGSSAVEVDTAVEEAKQKPMFESVLVATAVCASADITAVLGLFAACSLIGWRSVLRTSVITFAGISTIGGMVIGCVGAWALKTAGRDDALEETVSRMLLTVGAATFVVGVIGLVAAKGERRILLQIYAALLVICSFTLTGVCFMLITTDVEHLQPWLEHLSRLAVRDPDVGSTSVMNSKVIQAIGLLDGHRLSLSALAVLILFLLVMNVTMSCGLRHLIAARENTGKIRVSYKGLQTACSDSGDGSDDDGVGRETTDDDNDGESGSEDEDNTPHPHPRRGAWGAPTRQASKKPVRLSSARRA